MYDTSDPCERPPLPLKAGDNEGVLSRKYFKQFFSLMFFLKLFYESMIIGHSTKLVT